jgi:hypothetical protein
MTLLKSLTLATILTLIVVLVAMLCGCQAKATLLPPEIVIKTDAEFWQATYQALAQKRRETATQPAEAK